MVLLFALVSNFFPSSILAYDNWKVQADIADRRAFDEQQFREAGTIAPKRTFKFDPTRPAVKRK